MGATTVMYDLETAKMMFEMACSYDEADDVIKEYTGSDETNVKLDFLLKNYSLTFASSGDTDTDKGSEALILYEAIIKTIIGRKWR